MLKRSIVGLAFAAMFVPGIATAQFTTFIAPPHKVKDSVKAAAVAEQKVVRTASLTRRSRT